MSEARRFNAGEVVDDRYRIDCILGTGSFGTVYRAFDALERRVVAIKELLPEALGVEEVGKRFSREIRILKRLEPHENICGYLGEIRQRTGLVMEYVGDPHPPHACGIPVDLVVDGAVFRLPLALGLGQQVCRALGALHRQGINHRDLKPGNVLVYDGRVKLLDFGLARRTNLDEITSSFRTAADMHIGTPAFMAPEQIRGDALDPRADLYSLGVLLYRLCCGRLLFEPTSGGDANAMVAWLLRHLNEMPAPPRQHDPAIPAELDALIMSLLSKDRDRRPPSAADVSCGLAAAAKSLGLDGAGDEAVSPEGLAGARDGPPPDPSARKTLERACGRVAGGGLEVIIVAGDRGAGKTRLARGLRGWCPGKAFVEAWEEVSDLGPDAVDDLVRRVREADEATLVDLPTKGPAVPAGEHRVVFVDDLEGLDEEGVRGLITLVERLRLDPVLLLGAFETTPPRGQRALTRLAELVRYTRVSVETLLLEP